MMKVPHVDLLVVGLLVALLALKKAALEKAMVGSHQIGAAGSSPCTRHWPWPAKRAGALRAEHQKMATIGNEQSPSSTRAAHLRLAGVPRAWLVQKQSHSINRGMSDAAAAGRRDSKTARRNATTPLDQALRTGRAPIIFQKPFDMKRHLPLAESVAQQAVSTMRQWIETPESLQNIVLVGGGAFLFKKAVKAAFPKHRIHEVKEPLFANVRGFQIAGQNYAATAMVGTRERSQGDAA